MKTATKTPGAPGAVFIGRAAQRGNCDKCGRELGMTYGIRLSDGTEVAYGRRCAARALGWATSRVEMEAVIAERCAETTRRRAIVVAERPDLAAIEAEEDAAAEERRAAGFQVDYAGPVSSLISTAVGEDCWWGGRGWAAYATWQAYLEAQRPRV